MGKKSKRRGVIAGKRSAVGTSSSNGRCGGDKTAIVADVGSMLLRCGTGDWLHPAGTGRPLKF